MLLHDTSKIVWSENWSEILPCALETDAADKFMVYGRGVLHLSVLIETMRREGYELQIGQPQVIIKEIDGKKCEPIEELNYRSSRRSFWKSS
jgi:predicted membrane GTPase involved in stress response